jgi:anti-anti-sigma factor
MKLETAELAPDIGCIRVEGEVDSSNVIQLKDAFDQFFAKGIFRIVVNLAKAKYVSSTGVGCVIGAYTTSIKHSGRIVFASTPLQILEIFRVIGLGSILRFAKDEALAIDQFTA